MFRLPFSSTRSFESNLYDEVQFYHAFTNDIKHVLSTITIESPFICYRRKAYMLPDFVRAIDRGIAIKIYTRHPNEHEGSMRQQPWSVKDAFENTGVLGLTQYATLLSHRKRSKE
jgi:hypothetical protein